MAGATGRVTDCRSQEGLSDPDWTEEHYVFVAFEEAEGEELLDAVAVEGDRGVPVEALEGLLLLEAGATEPHLQVLLISAINLVLEGEFEEIEFREFRLAGIGDAVRERRQDAREAKPFHHRLEGLINLHRFPPSSGYE